MLVGSGLGCLWAAFVAPPPSFILSPESSGWGERNGESVSPLWGAAVTGGAAWYMGLGGEAGMEVHVLKSL